MITEPVESLPAVTLETMMSVLVSVLPWIVGLAVVSLIVWWLLRLYSSGRS